jgi:spore coat protein H
MKILQSKSVKQKVVAAALSASLLTASLGGAAGYGSSVAFASSAGVKQEYESIFQGDRVIDVKVTIGEEDWDSILANPLEKEYKSVSVSVDGYELENVGFSTKGNLTLKAVASMEDSDRYSFRLKFDKYDKSQTLLGLDKMVLNNNYSDPSYLREYLHYEALREIGLDAPETVFVNLYINGELYGFYTGVEAVDDSYLERNFGEDYDEGVLYDTEEKSYLQYEEAESYDTLTYDAGTKDDKASLKNFIRVLNEMPDGEKGGIEDVLDVDSALKYTAANAVLGNYDSYNGHKGHNYMLYGDAAGKYTVIPWDMNMSFNGYSGGGGGGNRGGAPGQAGVEASSQAGAAAQSGAPDGHSAAEAGQPWAGVAEGQTGAGAPESGAAASNTNAVTASIDTPVLGISMESVPMINNLLEVPEYKTRYLGYVSELTDYLEGIEDRITELADLVRPYVQEDPTKFYTMEQFEANVAYSSNEAGGAGMQGGGGFGGTPPEGMEGMTPPDGSTPPARPEGTETGLPPEAGGTAGTGGGQDRGGAPGMGGPGGQGQGQGMSMGTMASGSVMTFALNRLASLQEQQGRTVTPLPSTSSPASSAGNGISVLFDGSKLAFPDQQPVNQAGSILVPVKTIFDALGAEVIWDETAKTVTAVKGDMTIVLAIGSKTAYVNDSPIQLEVSAAILGDRTMVPVRFISEALGLAVDWDAAASAVLVTSK